MRSHNKTLFSKASKVLAEFNKVLNFEVPHLYAAKNLIETLYIYVLAVIYISILEI